LTVYVAVAARGEVPALAGRAAPVAWVGPAEVAATDAATDAVWTVAVVGIADWTPAGATTNSNTAALMSCRAAS